MHVIAYKLRVYEYDAYDVRCIRVMSSHNGYELHGDRIKYTVRSLKLHVNRQWWNDFGK